MSRANGWISVKKRLPKKKGMYLVYNPKMPYKIYTEPFMVFEHIADRFTSNPTHWKELPKPPKGVSL